MLSRTAIAGLCVVGLLVALSLLMGYWFGRSGESVNLRASDSRLLIRTEQLARYLGLEFIDADAINAERIVYRDGAQLLELRVESLAQRPDVFLRYAVYLESSNWAADLKYRSLWGGTLRELRATGADFQLQDRDELFAWGQSSRFAYVQLDAEVRGVLIIAKSDTVVIYLLAVGFAYDDHFGLMRLLADPLDGIEEHLQAASAAVLVAP